MLSVAGTVFSFNLQKDRTEYYVEDDQPSLFNSFKRLVLSGDKESSAESDGRINVLLLGVGGTGHAGPELSDTIIFSSLDLETNNVGMLSIPRDLAVAIPGYGYRKVNHANAYGEQETSGGGPEFAAEVIGETLSQHIDHTVKIDFNGFEDLIDAIGGINVYVDRSFTDNQYPTEDDLIQTIEFEEGWQHMNGEVALQFARSRHGTNGEGSDFARAERQQKIILAIKDEVLSPSVFLNPAKLDNVISTLQAYVQTNMTFWEIIKLAKYAPDIDPTTINHVVLDSSNTSPLYSTSINGAYVLLPKNDDWSDVHRLAEYIADPETETSLAYQTENVENRAKIEIQNGTSVSGLAFETYQLLAGSGFDVTKIGNADSKNYTKTIIYDLSEGELASELSVLQDFLEADVSMTTSGWIFSDEVVPRELTVDTLGEELATDAEGIDFLVILGEDTARVVMR